MAVGGGDLLFATGCCVARIPKEGGAEPVTVVGEQDPPIRALAADSESLYLLVGGSANHDGALLRLPRPSRGSTNGCRGGWR